MAKIKERKSESWKPGLLHDDGFISKNKKRKDKRMSLNLSAKKIDTDEFIPIKKSKLALGKAKPDSAKFLSPALDKKQTPKKDTPLSGLQGKKQNFVFTPNPKKLSLTASGTLKVKTEPSDTPKMKGEVIGTPKNKAQLVGTPKIKVEPPGTPKIKVEAPGTPKVKSELPIKSSLKRKAQKFIDDEAEEGEEPITDKNVKPYEKGQKRKSISFKFDNKKKVSDFDESGDSDDSDELTDARDFFDNQASEGEETDDDSDLDEASENESESENESDDDDDSQDDENGEGSDLFENFVNGKGDDESDEEDSEVDDESDEEDSDDDDGDDDDDDEDEDEEEEEEEEEKPVKVQEKKKLDNKTKVKLAPTPSAPLNSNKIDKTAKLAKANETAAEKSEPQTKPVPKGTKQEEKPKEKKTKATPEAISEYAGYIKYLPTGLSVDKIKLQLTTEISPENIVSIVLKKNQNRKSNRCLVYVTDEDSLDKLENKTFTIGTTTFKIFKARETKKLVKTKPFAFLPRVPNSIDIEKIESLIAADVGAENIAKLKNKRINNKMQTRNVLVEFANEESLKKVIYTGGYTCDGTEIVVRQAFESGFQIPIFKVVFSGVPEKVSEAVIKKAVEAKVGQGNVINVKFSFKTRSFAFVSLNNEQAQKKLLEPDMEISVKGTKVQIVEFKPRPPPKKRGSSSRNRNKNGPDAKKQKIDDSSSADSPADQSSKKKNKLAKQGSPPGKTQPKSQPQKNAPTQQKKQSFKPAQNDAQKSSSKKHKPQQEQQQSKQSSSPPPKNKKSKKAQNENQVPDKKASLISKIETKKNKLKIKKSKKKQADNSD